MPQKNLDRFDIKAGRWIGRHSDNRARRSVQRHRAIHRVHAAADSVLPQVVADDGHRMLLATFARIRTLSVFFGL